MKFWDCGRSAHAGSSRPFISTDEFVEQIAADLCGEDEDAEEEKEEDQSDAENGNDEEEEALFLGSFLPSRSLSNYCVRQPQDSSKITCRVSFLKSNSV